jgi:hypothetical protein
MRIKSFSEARGIFESEEFSLEPHIYCFGGGGGGGGGDSAGGSAGDFEGTNFGGDTATAGGSLSGGSDASGGFDPGFDEGDTGDTGVSSEVASSFGGGDGGAGAAGSSLIDSYLGGPMMADISTPMMSGAFVDPTTGYGIMSDIPGAAAQAAIDYTNALATGEIAPSNMAMTTGDLSTGTGGARAAGLGFDDPLGFYDEGDIEITAIDPSFDLAFAQPPAQPSSPSERVVSAALDPATNALGIDAFNFAQDVLGVDQSIPQMSLAPESRASQFDRQARMGEVQGLMSMAPVEATRFSGTDMMRQADDVLGQRAIDEAIFGDPSDMPIATVRAGMEIVNALESTFGGNQARKIADVANRPGGALVRDPQSGEVLGAVGPEENIQSAFMGAQDAVYVGDPRGYQQGVEVGTSILGPDTNVRDVGTMDPFTGEFEGRPGADYTNRGPTDTGGGDGGGQIIPPPQEVVPELPPEDYQGRDIVGGAPSYQPRGSISYDYTGLPSLAPTVLRPSYRPRGPYEALFPMGKRA